MKEIEACMYDCALRRLSASMISLITYVCRKLIDSARVQSVKVSKKMKK
jgi:hypothetical protein